MGLIAVAPKILTRLLIMGMLIGSALQAQVISARNLGGGLPLLDEDGNLLSTKVGRVELWWGTNLINQPIPGYPANRLVKDGYFAFGDPRIPGAESFIWIPITVRIWDSSVGETFTDAVKAGHGYASVETYAFPVTGLGPPYPLADLFPGLRLLPPLPHLEMTRGAKGFQLEVSAEDGVPFFLYGAPTPTGPWTEQLGFLGHGRSVPFVLPLNSPVYDILDTGPTSYYFKVVPE